MSFLSKHYEKLILAIFLLIFIVALGWMISITRKATQIKDGDLLVNTKSRADYIPFDFSSFSRLESLQCDSPWVASGKRSDSSNSSCDFLIPYQAAWSPYCGKLISYYYFENKLNCPVTGKSLAPFVTADVVVATPTNLDKDDDGIPNAVEKDCGLDPLDPEDASSDLDEDGFTNLAEYKYNPKGINDPKIHPPLVERLVLDRIKRVRLPVMVDRITKSADDKKTWVIQMKTRKGSQWKTKFLHIGETIDFENKSYTVKDIVYKTVDKLDPALNTTVEKNVSEVVLQCGSEDPLACVLNEPVYGLKEKIFLSDQFKGNSISTYVNETINVGDKRVGVEKYRVISTAENKKSVKVVGLADKKEHTINLAGPASTYKLPSEKRSRPKMPEELLNPEFEIKYK